MTTDRHEVDLTIIGAGPAGLYAAYYAGFRGLSVAVLVDEAAQDLVGRPVAAERDVERPVRIEAHQQHVLD